MFSAFMFQVLSWNVRGLNNSSKRGVVKSICSNVKKSVVCLQETKVEDISRSFLRSFAGSYYDRCQYLKSDGASGGIVTCWNARDFSCSEVLVQNFSLSVRLTHNVSNCSFLTNVYGPPTWEGKADFYDELSELKKVCNGRWIMCGDFNLTRNQDERRGQS